MARGRRRQNPLEGSGTEAADPAIETLRQAEPDDVQKAIDRMGERQDALPTPSQVDSSVTRQALDIEDAADPAFEQAYERSRERAMGYLQKRKLAGNRTGLVPAACEIHPKLGAWGLRFGGKWMIIRWISKIPTVRQKRYEQGWQYFTGKEWCERLGLKPENYLNEKGRIETGDVELAWATEEYIFDRQKDVIEAKEVMVAETREKLMGMTSKYVPNVEILEGDDTGVMSELHDRRRYAETRS